MQNQDSIKSQSTTGKIILPYSASEVEGECFLLQISPLKFILWKYVLFILSNIFVGLPLLILHWYPQLKIKIYYRFSTLQESTHFYILNYDEEVSFAEKKKKVFMVTERQSRELVYFVNRYMTYILQNGFFKVSLYDCRDRLYQILNLKLEEEMGLTESQAYEMRNTYGIGTMRIQKPPCLRLAFAQVMKPLFLFLIFSVLWWTFAQQYIYFTGIVFFSALVGLLATLKQIIDQNNKIFDMAYSQIPVHVLREGKIKYISSLQIAPGDITFLKDSIKLPFQGIILQGSILLNQCALTGQSVPVVKKADFSVFKRQKIDKNAIVYEGTTIIQVNNKKRMQKFQKYRQLYGVPVFVYRTNFVTTKGQLVRTILFPKQQENIFQKQSIKYLLSLFVLAVISYIVIIVLIYSYVKPKDIIFKLIDLITMAVPPAIPVSMTFGIIYAVQRLKDKQIFCVDPNKIIPGGLIQVCCFDKTGTLTDDFMNFYCLVPAHQRKFQAALLNSKETLQNIFNNTIETYLEQILTNMASNHSIIKIEETNELVGDPMEVSAFKFGQFRLGQSQEDSRVLFSFDSDRGNRGQVYDVFQFDADLQRMSVICKSSKNKFMICSKGSPEAMANLMAPTTIPLNYKQILNFYTSKGLRVLAIGSKYISEEEVLKISRIQAQKDLCFNGFQVFQNRLKPGTDATINKLRRAQLRCVMITGDNSLTGVNISYQSNISNKRKPTLICDFEDGKLLTETVTFQVDQNQKLSQYLSFQGDSQIFVKQAYANQSQSQISYSKSNKNEDDASQLDEKQDFVKNLLAQIQETNSQLCLTGRAFNFFFSGQLTTITPIQRMLLRKISVFSRTKPSDKSKIVLALQLLKKKVSMCGDGANDCGALKQADIGLSLSQAEASISAPFTSQITHISSLLELIKQCRAGLATNFSLFNIMTSYSLIQYTTSVIDQRYLQFPADMQYLYQDLFLNFFFILVVGYTKTAKQLTADRPSGSLFSATNISKVFIVFLIQFIGQIVMILVYQEVEPTYYGQFGGFDNGIISYNLNQGFAKKGPESNALFLFTTNLYLAIIIGFKIAKPWRQYVVTNIPFMIGFVICLAYNNLAILYQDVSYSGFNILFIPTIKLRWAIFATSWAFSLLIILLLKLVLDPLERKLRITYPNLTWL